MTINKTDKVVIICSLVLVCLVVFLFYSSKPHYFKTLNRQGAHSELDWANGSFTYDNWNDLYGSSMHPTFHNGNTALMKKYVPGYKIQEGEIIRYEPLKNKVILEDGSTYGTIHRVVAVYPKVLFTVGDNSDDVEMIGYNQVTHIVIGVLFT